ncbi:Vitelline membrane outer layer protein 1-like 8 [Homarus americanus]|uniref:Vitelline membrane outer layer protein 1-like 8 n=1 Tax=Homarus americanus TaxID=6706 RepID=A0A8J5K4D5_HOMAM|nr:Vitelline membrane outer layer protein 1-like 8 [Homarus americanus]
MRTTLFLALLVCFAAVLGQRDRIVTKSLVLDNGMDWGKWGEADYCDDGSFASFMEVKVGSLAITESCMRSCSRGFLTGLRAQVLGYQGVVFDDVAVQDIQMECNYGDEIIDGTKTYHNFGIPNGNWGTWARCPNGSAICGIETRLEDPNLVTDDTAVDDLSMFCCALNPTD